jgi:hypothetical protein
MATILESLQNAEYNLQNIKKVGLLPTKEIFLSLATQQLHNAITLLEKGFF